MGPRLLPGIGPRRRTWRHALSRRDHRPGIRPPLHRRRRECDRGHPARRQSHGQCGRRLLPDRGGGMRAMAAYVRERLSPTVFGPVFILLTVAAFWSAANASGLRLPLAALLGIALVVQFRLWDDLEDRNR